MLHARFDREAWAGHMAGYRDFAKWNMLSWFWNNIPVQKHSPNPFPTPILNLTHNLYIKS